ncbi:hypothetical protein DB347_05325 [Opitutaceae bacterium EW11]|nr:hypothetical protein DB347_05325 [Opitutaceae bacterium EW11]
MHHRILLLAVLLALLASTRATAATYDYAPSEDPNRALRMVVPDGSGTLRGVLFWGNGAGGDSRAVAEDPELVALAEAHGFCVVATSRWGNFSDPREYALFVASLRALAQQSGHPEIENGIWAPLGHSNGGQMSYALANLASARVVAFATSKGGYYNDRRPPAAALATPGLLVAGEVDTFARVSAIRDLFVGNRPSGALWAWVEEEGRGHEEGDSAELIRPFMDEMLHTRYPSGGDTTSGVPSLRPVASTEGWLVEPTSYRRGWAEISDYAAYSGDRRQAGWLPSKRLAYVFRAFASYGKATAEVALSAPESRVAPSGSRLGYRIGALAGNWTSVDFYDGSTLLGSHRRTEPGELSIATTATGPRYVVFHAVVNYADGSHRTTMPRRVFVTAPPAAPVAAPKLSWSSYDGHVCLLHWEAAEGATSYRIERAESEGGPWIVVGTTADTQFDEPALLSEISFRYRVIATANGRDIVASDEIAVRAPVLRTTRSRLTNLSARARVGRGDDTLIVGFIHQGGDKRVLLRAVGPTLTSYGLLDAHPDPRLRLMNNERVEELGNDDWSESADADSLAATAASVNAFALRRPSRDAAAVTTLRGLSSAHTILVEGGSDEGVALAEVYDADPTGPSRLINVSARASVGVDSGELIVGVILAGTDSATLLFRAAGPALRAFGVSGVLANPILSLHDATRELWRVSGSWSAQPNASQLRIAAAQLGASAFEEGSTDSALMATLNPGAYTLVVSGDGRSGGVVLVEAHAMR